MASRHNIFADDSATLCVVIPKGSMERLDRLGKKSERVRRYIVEGLERDERKMSNGKEG